MEGKALQWHQVYAKARKSQELPRWEEYVKALRHHFDSFLFKDPMSELMSLMQTATVKEYLDKLDELLNNADLNEAYAISYFLAELKNEIIKEDNNNSLSRRMLCSGKLNGQNYAMWHRKIQFLLHKERTLDHLTNLMPMPENRDTTQSRRDMDAYNKWLDQNKSACFTMLSYMHDNQICEFEKCPTAKELWEVLQHGSDLLGQQEMPRRREENLATMARNALREGGDQAGNNTTIGEGNDQATMETPGTTQQLTEVLVGALQGRQSGGRSTIIERFRKMNPPPFKGTSDSQGIQDWISRLEKIFDAVECPETERVTCAAFIMEDEADRWGKLEQERFIVSHELITWEKFVDCLYERYFPQSIRDQKAVEFLELV
ncbi:hypothetical protein BUALT_Bualt08G0028900 [Buddleja alternifolia]|uniref:Retrotransposon gag domain-containing protein n=1 Tax=Buddleja alternifolia TaxID=168488 RepID=A0AAV6X4L8_9LAMI|nr:hypothetical protein BUALT_Bualt08G0028900 [Buddleja alternifolia]